MPASWQDFAALTPNANDLIVILVAANLHAMTKKESETLYELIDGLRIEIEEAWMRWDS